MPVTFRAMGTDVEAWLDDTSGVDELRDWFETVERACSRFRPESELSIINGSGDRQIEVSPLLGAVLEAAGRARTLSGGLVDAGVGGAVVDWGYDRTFTEVIGLDSEPEATTRPNWSIAGTLLHRAPETRIDLGGIAKGWTCDRAVEKGLALVVSAGGDLRSADPDTTATVMDPWGREAARVHVGIGALATSSVSRRRWRVGGGEASHLMDPRTMKPVAGPVLTASAVTATAADAETAAKAVLLQGADGLAWADSCNWIESALVVWHDGSIFATRNVRLAA